MTRGEVEGRVPPYVFQTQAQYGYCLNCDKIYWRGTHVQHVLQALSEKMEQDSQDCQL